MYKIETSGFTCFAYIKIVHKLTFSNDNKSFSTSILVDVSSFELDKTNTLKVKDFTYKTVMCCVPLCGSVQNVELKEF